MPDDEVVIREERRTGALCAGSSAIDAVVAAAALRMPHNERASRAGSDSEPAERSDDASREPT